MLKRPTNTGRSSAGPPRLDLQLWRRAKLLVLLNAIPLLGGLVVAIGWWQGRLNFKDGSRQSLIALAVVLIACLAFAVAMWLVLPLARWLRAYPLWQCRHRSLVLWLIPAVLGTLVSFALALAGALAALAALALMITGAVRALSG